MGRRIRRVLLACWQGREGRLRPGGGSPAMRNADPRRPLLPARCHAKATPAGLCALPQAQPCTHRSRVRLLSLPCRPAFCPLALFNGGRLRPGSGQPGELWVGPLHGGRSAVNPLRAGRRIVLGRPLSAFSGPSPSGNGRVPAFGPFSGQNRGYRSDRRNPTNEDKLPEYPPP